MVRKKGSFILCGVFLFVTWNALLLLFHWGRLPTRRLGEGGQAEPGSREELGGAGLDLAKEMIRLADQVESELETQKKLLLQLQRHRPLWEGLGKRVMDSKKGQKDLPQPPQKYAHLANVGQSKGNQVKDSIILPIPDIKVENKELAVNEDKLKSTAASSSDVIPILVIACDRVTVKRCLDKLIQYRPSAELYPIIVSQDCGHTDTARVIASYGSQVAHLRQPDLSDIQVRPEHKKFQGYYKISRHYRWALNQVFNTLSHSTVVIVEDDLEVNIHAFYLIKY